jgi:hypothetical protein
MSETTSTDSVFKFYPEVVALFELSPITTYRFSILSSLIIMRTIDVKKTKLLCRVKKTKFGCYLVGKFFTDIMDKSPWH